MHLFCTSFGYTKILNFTKQFSKTEVSKLTQSLRASKLLVGKVESGSKPKIEVSRCLTILILVCQSEEQFTIKIQERDKGLRHSCHYQTRCY